MELSFLESSCHAVRKPKQPCGKATWRGEALRPDGEGGKLSHSCITSKVPDDFNPTYYVTATA